MCGKTFKSHHNMKEDSLVEESDLQEDGITEKDIELTMDMTQNISCRCCQPTMTRPI